MLTTSNLSYVVDEVVSAVAFETFFQETFMMPVLYDVRTSGRRRERMASFGGLGEFEVKTPTVEPNEDEIAQQFEKDFVHVAYGKQVPVEREIVDDEEWGLLADIGQQLGYMAAYTMEKKAAALFNDAFSGGTYKCEDGKSICNSAHTNSDGGNSQSNSSTNSFNFAGLETTRLAQRKLTNYRGDKLGVRPRLQLVPVELEQTGWELLKSIGKPDTANNNLNYYQGMYDLAVWDFLTDTNAWFSIDPSLMKQNLIWYQRIALEVFGDGNLFAGTKKIGGYFRASHGCRDWRWIYGNNPS